MPKHALPEKILALTTLLAEVDNQLAEVPAAPEGLEDLKGSVDQLRTSLWAILRAGYGATAPVRVEQLKLRRAIDGLQAIQDDLASRPGAKRHPEHLTLVAVARSLTEAIESGA